MRKRRGVTAAAVDCPGGRSSPKVGRLHSSLRCGRLAPYVRPHGVPVPAVTAERVRTALSEWPCSATDTKFAVAAARGAMDDALGSLEAEAMRRAVQEGYQRPGARLYSDNMLLALLRARPRRLVNRCDPQTTARSDPWCARLRRACGT